MPLTLHRGPSTASRQTLGALPRRLRRPTLVVIGCGDVGLRLIAQRIGGPDRLRIIATARRVDQIEAIRRLGAIPFACNLDDRHSLARLAGLPGRLIHLAPPPSDGDGDRRTRLLTALYGQSATRRGVRRQPPARWAYISTTGVYGDCQGAKVDESQPLRPSNPRSARRVAAERTLREFGRRTGTQLGLLRAPGIYAENRLPVERLKQGQPALVPDEDVYTNHIHADDLAQAAWVALHRARGGRAFNICDDTDLKMGDYFDTIADGLQLPRPPRMSRADVAARVSPMMLSFMNDSRRLSNMRMKRELLLRLKVPNVQALLALL